MKKKLLFILLTLISFNTASPRLFDRFRRWVTGLKERRLPVVAQIGIKNTKTKVVRAKIEQIKESIEDDLKSLVAELETKEYDKLAEALKAVYSASIEKLWKKRLEEGKAVADKIIKDLDVYEYQMSHAQIKLDQARTDLDEAIKLQKKARTIFESYKKMAIQKDRILKIKAEGKKAAEKIEEEEEGKKAAEEIKEAEEVTKEEEEETKVEPEEEEEELPREVVMADETIFEKLEAALRELTVIIQKMKELDQQATKRKKQDILDNLNTLFKEEKEIKNEYKKLQLRLKTKKVPEDEIQKFIDRIKQLGSEVDEVEGAF